MTLEVMNNADYELIRINNNSKVIVYSECRKGYDDVILDNSLNELPSEEDMENGYTISLRILVDGFRHKFEFFSKGIWNPKTSGELINHLNSIINDNIHTENHIVVDLESPLTKECRDQYVDLASYIPMQYGSYDFANEDDSEFECDDDFHSNYMFA